MLSGTLPPKRSSSIWAEATMSRALARQKPQDWTYVPTSSTSAAAKDSSVG